MATIKELKELALHAAKGTAPANFSTQNVNDALREEMRALAGSINEFQRNKHDIFDIIITAADEVVPKKVMDAVGMFAEVVSVPQGQKIMFKTKKGHARARKFLTQVGLSGLYLWSLLNQNYNEENGWVIDYTITEVYDDYALAYNYAEAKFERVYYTKDNENDEISINEKMPVYIMDLSEKEKDTVETLRALNGGSYELVNETLEHAAEYKENSENFGLKIEELNNTITTLTTERDEAVLQFTAIDIEGLNATIESLTTQVNELNGKNAELETYKANVVKAEKEAVVSSYAEMLSDEKIAEFKANFDKYENAIELDKELAYELKKSNPSVFAREPQYIPKDAPTGGLEDILSKYKK